PGMINSTERKSGGDPMSKLRCIAFAFTALLIGGPAHAIDDATIAAAKKEGEVVWYTTQIVSQLVRPVAAAFEKKYGVKVLSTRANSTETAAKIFNDRMPGRGQADISDGTTTVVPIKKKGFALKWLPDAAKAYP